MYDEPCSFREYGWDEPEDKGFIVKGNEVHEPQPFYAKQECMNVRRPKRSRVINRLAKQARKRNR